MASGLKDEEARLLAADSPESSSGASYDERAYDSDEKVVIALSDDEAAAGDGEGDAVPPFSWSKLWKFTGPGFLMCIAFLDPGNLEADLQSGAIAGYSLLWLLMWATVMGLLIQMLSARLGVATGRHLAELCREEYPRWARWALWAMAELALIGADIQEVIGSAIAIKILSGGVIPLWAGVVITALDCFIFLFLENYGVRKLEAFFGILIAAMAISFAIMFGETKPSGKELLIGVLVPKLSSRTIRQAVAVVGCIIMPHNVFLHSALVQSRKINTNKKSRVQEAMNYYLIESTIALIISFGINVCVTAVFAKEFYGTKVADSIGLENAGSFLQEKYGSTLFPILYIWGIGLLASGQSSTITGTYAGQFIMGGFLNLRLKKWMRALITRSTAIVPTIIVALVFDTSTDAMDVLNESLNVLQSIQIPFALIPLITLVSKEQVMGAFKIGPATKDPRFQPDLSSTYEPVRCNPDCNCDNEKMQCVYERQYAEMSSSSGVLGEDIVSFGNESALKPQRAVFGCENSESGDLFSQHADGIMGLGRGQLSIMDQLVEKDVISDSFSLCYGGMDIGGGAMVLGGISNPPDMVFTASDPGRSPYYNIELKEIHVAGKPLRLNPRVFDSKHGTVLDSGTTYAYLPEEAFIAFRDAIVSKLHSLKQIHGPDPNYKDICFSGASNDVSELSSTFPEVVMVFGNGQKLSLSPENYLFRHSKVRGAYCLGIFQNGKDPTTLLGGIVVRNTLVTYDRQNQKIGFWKTNCSELWERLHTDGAPSPAPSTSSDQNLTIELSPALSPNGQQDSVLPGQFEVGLITFDMSLNVTYSKLVPHITELAELIAHELEVDAHQVHLMNFTNNGNSSLIRWAIFPSGSANFISNTTAMGIIARLTEHRVRLPENFGSYQLVEWNVEPPSRRTWWRQHVLAMVVGVAVVVVLGFSVILVWYVWRRRQRGPATYRPVDAAVPEQELQPM